MRTAITLALSLALAGPAAADLPFGGVVSIPEAALATMRGGILLSNGTNIAVGIALETRVDGVLALRTQYSTETPGIQVFASGVTDAPAGGVVTVHAGNVNIAGSTIRIDRTAMGTTITTAPAIRVNQLRVSLGDAISPPADNATALALVPGGAAVPTALGMVRIIPSAGGTLVELAGRDLAIQQVIGQATGVIVANTANDRVIDTITTVNIDQRGTIFPSGLISALERVGQAVADRSRF